MKPLYSKFLVVGIFAIAMGFLEAVVVVYLRQIYYPDGFEFPLNFIDSRVVGIELVRELTTMVMLICIGLLVGKSKNEKFAWFIYTFGIWDIFYYIGLKAFLDWPASLLSWDILFLIPGVWIGPVLAPVICSLTMILLAGLIVFHDNGEKAFQFGRTTWLLLIIGSSLIFITYIQDYAYLMTKSSFTISGLGLSELFFNEAVVNFVPDRFNWWLFILGELMILAGIGNLFRINYR